MATTWIGTGDPTIVLKNSSDVTLLTLSLPTPVYNRIFQDKLQDSALMANGKLKRYTAGVRYSGEIYYDVGMLTQTQINNLKTVNEADGLSTRKIFITPRSSNASFTGQCNVDIKIEYRDDRINAGTVATISWEFQSLE